MARLFASKDVDDEDSQSVSETVANFARINILVTIFDGQPDPWLDLIEREGSAEEREKDVPFLRMVKQRMGKDPTLVDDMKYLVSAVSELPKRIEIDGAELQRRMQHLIEAMTPSTTVPMPPQVLQAQRNAALRQALIDEFGALTSTQIGEVAGSRATNRAALAHRWKNDGRIFSVMHHGATIFPGFQFSGDGQPRPIIADVLRTLGSTASGWEIAIWFIAPNTYLAGRRPVDLLESEPDDVIDAARHEAEPIIF